MILLYAVHSKLIDITAPLLLDKWDWGNYYMLLCNNCFCFYVVMNMFFCYLFEDNVNFCHLSTEPLNLMVFIRPSRDGPYYVIGYGGRASTGFRTITLVLYIRSLPNLAT